MNRAAALRVLALVSPERRVTELDLVPAGGTKRTFAATLDDTERVVVQLHPDPGQLRREAALARAIADRTTITVPTVRSVGTVDGATHGECGRCGEYGEYGYLVTDRAPGVDLHERFVGLPPEKRRRIAASFGRALGELHETFRFEGHGRLSLAERDDDHETTEPPELVVADPVPWPSWFDRLTTEGLDALPPELASLRGRIETALDGMPRENAPATLFPWDLRPGNARYDADSQSLSLLDWGDGMTADAAFSLAKTEYVVVDWYTPSPALRDAFHDGYRETSTLVAEDWTARRPYDRLAAIVRTAVDSHGAVTRPGYPERSTEAAVAFHRGHLESVLESLEK